MNVTWDDWELFVAVAEELTLSGAARRLGVSQPTVSRRLSLLETKVPTPLFVRTSEGAHLTERGRTLLPEAIRMASAARESTRLAAAEDLALKITVRVNLPEKLAACVLSPLLKAVASELPSLRLSVHTRPGPEALEREGAQVVCLPAQHLPASLRPTEIVEIESGLFAAHTYQKGAVCKHPNEVDFIASSAHITHTDPLAPLLTLTPALKVAFHSSEWSLQVGALRAGMGAMLLPLCADLTPTKLVPLDVGLPKTSERFSIAVVENAEVASARQVAALLSTVLKRTSPPTK